MAFSLTWFNLNIMLCYASRELKMQKHFAGEPRGCVFSSYLLQGYILYYFNISFEVIEYMQTFRNTASSKLCSISLIASLTVAWNSRITQWTKGIWITKNIGSMFIWAKARRLWKASKQIHQRMLSVNKTHFIFGKTT